MVDNYQKYIEEISKITKFIRSTLEKVDRLLTILEWINNQEKLGQLLALKGGTAINAAVFNFPRLSVDIDLDLTENFTKSKMLSERNYIYNLIVQYLINSNYKINNEKSKNVYALDSIVAEYVDIKGNTENIKIEINYMNRVHILETKLLEINTDIFPNKHFKINCVNPIEIYAAKICALLNRATARDLFDVYTLSKYNLFDKEEKHLLKQCFMLEYIAINGYKIEDMNIEKTGQIKNQDIKTKLLSTLKDRNPKHNNVDTMKKEVKEYLKDILVIDSKTQKFYDEFQKGIYEPELLFDDIEILNRIKNHPMIMWKLENKNN